MADSLYGQKDLAEFCEYVIASLFEVAARYAPHASTSTAPFPASTALREGIDTPPYTPPAVASPNLVVKEPPVLLEFIAYALYRTRLPIAIVHQSLLLLSRLKQRYPSARGTSSSPHRLFLSSLMLSAKISMDDTYSNKSWAIVGSNYFSLAEVNQMERELFAFLGWNVVTKKEELDEFVASAQAAHVMHRKQQAASLMASQHESAKRRRVAEEQQHDAHRHEQARNAARALLRPHTYRASSISPPRSSESRRNSPGSRSAAVRPASMSAFMPSSAARAASPARVAALASTSSHQPVASTSSSSMVSSHNASPVHYRSYNSSTATSAVPSAIHSPSSPISAPLSAGPQTPDHDHQMDLCPTLHDTLDSPEAATYVNKAAHKAAKSRNVSPHHALHTRQHHHHLVPSIGQA